jgi:hypothetical protein
MRLEVIEREGFEFDHAELLRAIDDFGIKRHVQIKFHAKGIYRRGTHYDRKHGSVIILNPKLTSTELNFVLWHELAHAAQSEKWSEKTGRPVTAFYDEMYRKFGTSGMAYKSNPYEVDANRIATEQQHRILLRRVF